jgi:AraC-like DNA-binding protein
MDNSDPFTEVTQAFGDLVEPLRSTCWPVPAARSSELTPLYIQRYVGPRAAHPPTAHSFWELTYVFDGEGQMISNDKHTMRPGCTLIIPPELPHAERADKPMDTLWVGLHGSALRAFVARSAACIEDASLTPIMERMWSLTRMPRHRGGVELDGLARLTVGRVLAATEEAEPGDWTGRVLRHLHDNLHRPITVAHLADTMGCSEGYLHRRFKQAAGQTPGRALQQMRMERARDLMQHTSLGVKQISRRVGIQDPLYFSRVFSKVYGYPPKVAMRRLRT